MMLKVGLTGGIGSGKTMVAKIFKVLGIPVFDADAAARELMEQDQQLAERIRQVFGMETYTDGRLNRKVLADIVFRDPFLLEQLNALVHPATIAAAEKWAAEQQAPYSLKEAALMFEAGSAANLQFIIGVYAPQALRIRRVMERNGVSREDVLSRMGRQIDDTIKMRLCDFVIINDEQQMIIPQVLSVHENLLIKAKEYG